MSDSSRIYAPELETGFEAGAAPDAATLSIMGVTLAAVAGLAFQAFDSAPAPVIAAPEGPSKVRVTAERPADPLADSTVYLAMQGEPIDEQIAFRLPDEAPLSPLELGLGGPEASEALIEENGPFLVQLGAFRGEAEARAHWLQALQRRPALLADAAVRIERVQAGARGEVFRLRAGAFATREAASELCSALQAAGLDCMAVAA